MAKDKEKKEKETVETPEVNAEEVKEEAIQSETDVEASDNPEENQTEETDDKVANREQQKLKDQIAELNDKVVRQMAEFDNFRKRSEKEKQQMFETGAKSVIEKILPIVDNFERGIAALSDEEKDGQFAQGVVMVYKQLMDELEKMEVKPIEAVGKEFDPNLHNAVMHIEDENLGENTIAQELQKGYTYRDQVVRHSMVQVAN